MENKAGRNVIFQTSQMTERSSRRGGTYLDTKILLSFSLFVHKILIHSHSEVFSNSSGNVREMATLKQENLCKLQLNHLCFSQRFRFPSEIRTEFPWSFSASTQQNTFLTYYYVLWVVVQDMLFINGSSFAEQ